MLAWLCVAPLSTRLNAVGASADSAAGGALIVTFGTCLLLETSTTAGQSAVATGHCVAVRTHCGSTSRVEHRSTHRRVHPGRTQRCRQQQCSLVARLMAGGLRNSSERYPAGDGARPHCLMCPNAHARQPSQKPRTVLEQSSKSRNLRWNLSNLTFSDVPISACSYSLLGGSGGRTGPIQT